MVEFWLFLIEAIPLAIVIGISAACIGYTAWGIMVPLLFVGFGFNIFDAIVLSLIIDFVNSVILTTRYSKSGKVDFKQGTKWGILALISAVIAAFFAIDLLAQNEELLRGGVAYVFFLLSAFFVYRGYNLNKKEKNQLNGAEDDSEKSSLLELPSGLRNGIMVIGVVLSGIISGLLGIGSGSNYALLFMFVLGAEKGFDTLRATGTSCYIMAIVTVVLAIFFSLFGLVNFSFILPYLIVGVIFSAIGTIIGTKITLKVSESKLNYIVGIAILITAVVATIQAIVFIGV